MGIPVGFAINSNVNFPIHYLDEIKNNIYKKQQETEGLYAVVSLQVVRRSNPFSFRLIWEHLPI